MKNKSLSERLAELGYPLFAPETEPDANATLADVVRSENPRYREGFPVVLANAAEKGRFDYEQVRRHLKNSSDRATLDSLLLASLALFRVLNMKFPWAKSVLHLLGSAGGKRFDNYSEKLNKGEDLKVGRYVVSAERLKAAFKSYYVGPESSRVKDLVEVADELGLEYALAQVFSPKQKELFLKKLRREKLTKTEREYFSRAVKKKVLALANPELHRLAQKLL